MNQWEYLRFVFDENGQLLTTKIKVDGVQFDKNDIDADIFEVVGEHGWEMCGIYQRPQSGDMCYWFKRQKKA